MSVLPETDQHMTEAEYLTFERESEFRHEFIDGKVYAMTGASRKHNLIAGSTIAILYTQLRGRPCELYPSDMKVRIAATSSYAYPDITVVCGDPEFSDDHRDILLNPTVIIEVLSPNTERYDRGRKFQLYRELASLQEYILISQDSPQIERFLRQENAKWLFSEARGLQATLVLSSIECTLVLAEVYEKIDFDEADQDDESTA